VVLATATGDAASGVFGLFISFGLIAAVIASAIWFFRGPATAAERYVDTLALQLQNPQEAALFRNIYKTKDPKSTTVAWLLTAFLSPTIGYIYQGKWALAAISFLTLQGLFLWWIVGIFTTPIEVLQRNKRLADEAFNQVMLGRGAYGHQGQVINVNQYAYLPHPTGSAPNTAGAPDVPSENPGSVHADPQVLRANPVSTNSPHPTAYPGIAQSHPPSTVE
jgi:hypothetical protein